MNPNAADLALGGGFVLQSRPCSVGQKVWSWPCVLTRSSYACRTDRSSGPRTRIPRKKTLAMAWPALP